LTVRRLTVVSRKMWDLYRKCTQDISFVVHLSLNLC